MKKQIRVIAIGLTAILFSTATFAAVKNVNTSAVNETTVKKVSTSFKDAGDNGYTIRSVVDGNDVMTAFDKKGNLVYSIEYLNAGNLAKDIIDIVKDGYGKYYISGMEKITQPGLDNVFIVRLEDAVSIKTLRVSGGEYELVQEFTKG